ncbi:GspE/PulE family protein [Plesiomonas sp. ZOR0011]|uniref:GspE/PulE family protein n=1 Tax=Plesiomonas sp. ZOR0011 TaxID=1339230 RepID=UPI00064675BF|nr:ATPase, T2SS/T4P/T4SS family [Plesiomonas sp. ZOR0011]
MSQLSVSPYIYLDKNDSEKVVLYASKSHNDLPMRSAIAEAIKRYPDLIVERVDLETLKELQNKDKELRKEVENRSFSAEQEQIIGLFREAKKLNASDIHLLIGMNGVTIVEFRVHGDLEQARHLDLEEGKSLASTIIMSMCDMADPSFYPNREQDARLRKEFLQNIPLFGARYAHRPAEFGLYVVLRIIPDEGNELLSLEKSGFLHEQQILIRRMLTRPEGVITISGPTGSGKSTTLRTFSSIYLEFTGNRKRLLTLEDPPEGLIPGAVQTAIIADRSDPDAVSHAWVRAISASLRLDPDSMIVGEMRDANSVKSTQTAAKTGHLVLTTLHANDSVGILDRLTDTLDIPMSQVADPQVMIGLIAQRLVQELCPKCKKSWGDMNGLLPEESVTLLKKFCDVEKLYFRNQIGCENCHKGVVGRRIIAEVIRPDVRFMELFRYKGKLAARSYWVNELGGITRLQHLMRHIHDGVVDPIDADRICPLDEDSLTLLPSGEVV